LFFVNDYNYVRTRLRRQDYHVTSADYGSSNCPARGDGCLRD
jgi:hypothetical protein